MRIESSATDMFRYFQVDVLEAIGDPTHEEHLAMWRWAGGPFDPLSFDVNAANIALRNLKP